MEAEALRLPLNSRRLGTRPEERSRGQHMVISGQRSLMLILNLTECGD